MSNLIGSHNIDAAFGSFYTSLTAHIKRDGVYYSKHKYCSCLTKIRYTVTYKLLYNHRIIIQLLIKLRLSQKRVVCNTFEIYDVLGNQLLHLCNHIYVRN